MVHLDRVEADGPSPAYNPALFRGEFEDLRDGGAVSQNKRAAGPAASQRELYLIVIFSTFHSEQEPL
jgi:hypothetical protein